MTTADEARLVEQLMLEWNSRRVTEVYRRVTFTAQRDEIVARWNAHGPHGVAEADFVAFRISHGDMALREIVELEERSDITFAKCRSDMDNLASFEPKALQRALSRLADICRDAMRVDMRYQHSLATTFQHEVKDLIAYVENRLEEAG